MYYVTIIKDNCSDCVQEVYYCDTLEIAEEIARELSEELETKVHILSTVREIPYFAKN